MADHTISFVTPGFFAIGYGRVTYGAEPLTIAPVESRLPFMACEVECEPGLGAYMLTGFRGDDVVETRTSDGTEFSPVESRFTLPAAETRWLARDIAVNTESGFQLLIACQLGTPPEGGHPFYAFGRERDGAWRQLSATPLFRGQDAFGLIWNQELRRFVLYLTSYQPWKKRYPDNMPAVRRVLHIRTSPDGLVWESGDSYGVSGPHLSADQFILPDEQDPAETEFYKFKAIRVGGLWAGIMVKYISQPGNLPKSGRMPHGPFLGAEWWVSSDGLVWERPFRGTSNLESAPFAFCYRLTRPIIVNDEFLWLVDGHDLRVNPSRLFYIESAANAEITTRPFKLMSGTLRISLSFNSARLGQKPHFSSGYLMAELQDASGKTLLGFEKERCVILPDDRTVADLRWEGADVVSLAGLDVRLKLFLRNVRLYGIER